MSKVTLEKLAVAVEALQKQVAALTERVARLEPARATRPQPAAVPSPAPALANNQDEITPEILLAISAAVAALPW